MKVEEEEKRSRYIQTLVDPAQHKELTMLAYDRSISLHQLTQEIISEYLTQRKEKGN